MAITYFPRLTNSVAISLIGDFSRFNDPSELTQFAATRHEMQYHDPLATLLVEESELSEVRKKIVALANELGFPEQLGRQAVRSFDQPAADILYNSIDLVPAEAANGEIWNFLTLALLPDIAAWRYPNVDAKYDFERWLGGDRNVFRKLWWRQATLGKTLNEKIGEDEAVGVMERPSLSANPINARAIISAFDEVYKHHTQLARSEVMRLAALHVRRLVPLIDFDFYEEDELRELLIPVIENSCVEYENEKRTKE